MISYNYEMLEPYKKGFLPVSDGYELYYEFCGNPEGKKVLFIHGGPGAGFSEKDKKFFDMQKWNVLFYEQRGAGRSKPFATIKNNTTQKLVEDIDALLHFAEWDKTFLFGGSWGSTLALVYAISHPEKVTGMVIRGIWLANKNDKLFYLGGGNKIINPEAWEKFIGMVPDNRITDVDSYYLEQMQSDDKDIAERFTYAWAYYETSILRMKISEAQIKEDLIDFNYRSLAPLEAHFISNNCFLTENYILDNADKLKDIPIHIIHGRYDAICPYENAYLLHKKVPHSKLIPTIAGHASSEEENYNALITSMKEFTEL
jgi:proline iminopeptidase